MKRVRLYTPLVLPYRTTLVIVLVLATKKSLVLGRRVWTLCNALTAQAIFGWLTLMCDMANPGPDVAVTIATRHWLLVPAMPPLSPNMGCFAGMKTILLRLHIYDILEVVIKRLPRTGLNALFTTLT